MNPIVIIGSGHAGLNVAREIRANIPETPMVILSKESICAYYKPNLSKALSMGKSADQLVMKTEEKLSADLNAELVSQVEASSIDASAKLIRYHDRQGVIHQINYHALVLATGASPIRLPIEKQTDAPFFHVNDLEDYKQFRDAIVDKKRVLIIGAGFVGCELASDLNSQDYEVAIIDKGQWPLQRVIPEMMGSAIKHAMTEKGTTWHFGVVLESVIKENGSIRATLSDGTTLETDIIISAVGLKANTALAEQAGLDTGRGIIIDSSYRTSDSSIFALGDCVQIQGNLMPFIAPATHAAKSIGKTLSRAPTSVAMPSLAVAVKIAACATVICPSLNGKGVWEIQGAGRDLEAHQLDKNGEICGFALTGERVSRKNELAKQINDRGTSIPSQEQAPPRLEKTAMI